MLCGNLTPEDKNRDAPWTHLRLFKEPLIQQIGNSMAFTAKKEAHAFGHSLHTARGIAAGYAHRHLSNNPIYGERITDRLDGLDRFKGTYPRFVIL